MPAVGSRSPGEKLRDAIQARPLMIPGAFSPYAAKLAARHGFRAIYLSGGALSANSGVPDIGLLGLAEFAAAAQAITSVCDLPLLCDADTGFGEALNVERTVQTLERAGAAGLHLEDQVMPKRCGHLSGKSVVPADVMAAKIRAAVAARTDPSFLIIARTDARGVSNFDDAVERANLYRRAGADAIFPEAMEGAEEFARFAERSPGLLLANMTEFGKGPLLDAAQLAAMGYGMILYPLTAFRAAMKAADDVYADLAQHGHQRNSVPRMQTRAELYDVLGYTGYESRDKGYFQ
jgi:methylisocitrate lyase